MTLQEFKEPLFRKPFLPFRITLSSGQSFDVRHPETAFLSRTNIYIGAGGFEDGIPAEYRICSLLHVTSIEPIDSASPA
jgi:hypothetical protein